MLSEELGLQELVVLFTGFPGLPVGPGWPGVPFFPLLPLSPCVKQEMSVIMTLWSAF